MITATTNWYIKRGDKIIATIKLDNNRVTVVTSFDANGFDSAETLELANLLAGITQAITPAENKAEDHPKTPPAEQPPKRGTK